MTTMAQLRYSALPAQFQSSLPAYNRHLPVSFSFSSHANSLFCPLHFTTTAKQLYLFVAPTLQIPSAATGDGGGVGGGVGGHGHGGWSGGDSPNDDSDSSPSVGFGPIGAFLNGWRSRVAADPQFPFKVLMEELVGVSASVVGDMASRPNFGLNELDFVFSTLVVGSILNFVLMYLLAPTATASGQSMHSIFAGCPSSHMFEPGPYGLLSRFGTFVYKGILFATVGFAAGLVGTAISNGLIAMRKRMDPNFETPNKAPPTILNALTWALHMGGSSNLRYQTLNGIEFLLAKGLPPLMFKGSVVVLRCLNNVLGGMSFVILARVTGSQAVEEGTAKVVVAAEKEESAAHKDKLAVGDASGYLPNSDSASK